jgi:endonuclease YncB( thermonuclease family)
VRDGVTPEKGLIARDGLEGQKFSPRSLALTHQHCLAQGLSSPLVLWHNSKNKMKSVPALLLLLLTVPLLAGETYSGRCVSVHDGDTISVMKAGRAVKIRLEGIDCPELGQDFGTRAKQFTSGMVYGKDVEVKEYNRDIYRRTVARVYIQGKDVSLELVKAGLAWHFKKYSSDPVLAEAEESARKAKAGLWSMPSPVLT